MGNIISGIMRKAMKDVEVKGHLIPKGWCVFAYFRSVHLDDHLYEEAYCFNPWRWKGKDTGTCGFTPFGGGRRLCPGLDLARLEASIFLHHLVTGFTYRSLVHKHASSLDIGTTWFQDEDWCIPPVLLTFTAAHTCCGATFKAPWLMQTCTWLLCPQMGGRGGPDRELPHGEDEEKDAHHSEEEELRERLVAVTTHVDANKQLGVYSNVLCVSRPLLHPGLAMYTERPSSQIG
ncbi:cytochrome P450 [Musa troglodytarum]|uniref:Cytochrome P450 n=1 Tax=Musa troglodytarum TaxID=320322 RepID=A0A9E7JMJ4_9LILI|nr:cytochrome P450 [Musa troglodytarum]